MHGNVKKKYEGPLFFGVGQFLERWQTDALVALTECGMGDRDSYAGQYHCQLIDEGFLDRAEVESVCLEWFKQGRYRTEHPWRGFDDVVSIAAHFRMPTVLAWIAQHFSELLSYVGSEPTWSRQNLIFTVGLVPDMRGEVWTFLRDYLQNEDWSNQHLFEIVYFNHRKHAENGEADRFLYEVSKRARVQKRVDGDNAHLVRSLYFMLLRKFGYDFKKDTPREVFDRAGVRAERWLESQATRCAFPV